MREALIITLRVELPERTPAPQTWPDVRAHLEALPPDSTRVEVLAVRED